jgi:hypothetical protein
VSILTLTRDDAERQRPKTTKRREKKDEAAMKMHQVLVEILILGSVAACVLALLIATLGTAAGVVGAVSPSQAIQSLSHNAADGRIG